VRLVSSVGSRITDHLHGSLQASGIFGGAGTLVRVVVGTLGAGAGDLLFSIVGITLQASSLL
jgi:hypothetical protein